PMAAANGQQPKRGCDLESGAGAPSRQAPQHRSRRGPTVADRAEPVGSWPGSLAAAHDDEFAYFASGGEIESVQNVVRDDRRGQEFGTRRGPEAFLTLIEECRVHPARGEQRDSDGTAEFGHER